MPPAASVAPVAGAAGIASPVEVVEYVGVADMSVGRLAVATAGFGRRVAVAAASRAVAEAASRSVLVALREFQSDSHSGIPSCCGSVAPEHCCFPRQGCARSTGILVVVVVVVVAGLAIAQQVNSSRVLAIKSD